MASLWPEAQAFAWSRKEMKIVARCPMPAFCLYSNFFMRTNRCPEMPRCLRGELSMCPSACCGLGHVAVKEECRAGSCVLPHPRLYLPAAHCRGLEPPLLPTPALQRMPLNLRGALSLHLTWHLHRTAHPLPSAPLSPLTVGPHPPPDPQASSRGTSRESILRSPSPSTPRTSAESLSVFPK